MINKVVLIGNLCEQPAVKYTQTGKAVTNFSLATNRTYKDTNGNKQQDAEFHRIVVWDTQAEFCGNYLNKGSKVYIEGRLQTRSYEDSNNIKKYTTEIVAQTVQNLSPKEEKQERPQFDGQDDVPF